MSIEKAYDSWSAIYDSNDNRTRDLDRRISHEVLSDHVYENILELGCGTGKNTSWLLKLCRQIDAVDFSEQMLAVAKSKIVDSKVQFHKLDIKEKWTFRSDYYDLVTCNLVLEHIEDLLPIFEKVYARLKAGGKFFISELHPFKQYFGSKASYESDKGTEILEVYTHHVSDFFNAALGMGFRMRRLDEWFDVDKKSEVPRLISFLFEKR